MKNYINPEMNIQHFTIEDIITTSNPEGMGGGSDFGGGDEEG